MIMRLMAFALGIFVHSVVLASSIDTQQDLFYLGKPIDPLCFFNLERQSNRIELNRCGIVQQQLAIKSRNKELLQQGFTGFDWQDPKASYPAEGYSYYKSFAAGPHQYWVYTLNNGGSNGDFTAVSFVKRISTDTLEINHILGGDRCNGGIQNVVEKNKRLSITTNLTAYDVFTLANLNPHHLKAYNDLSACASCCIAKAVYEVEANVPAKLAYINLVNASDMPRQGRYQACFNQLLASYSAKGMSKISSKQLKQVVQKFNEQCVR